MGILYLIIDVRTLLIFDTEDVFVAELGPGIPCREPFRRESNGICWNIRY
jgi:hypothetical protein